MCTYTLIYSHTYLQIDRWIDGVRLTFSIISQANTVPSNNVGWTHW